MTDAWRVTVERRPRLDPTWTLVASLSIAPAQWDALCRRISRQACDSDTVWRARAYTPDGLLARDAQWPPGTRPVPSPDPPSDPL